MQKLKKVYLFKSNNQVKSCEIKGGGGYGGYEMAAMVS